MCKVFISALIGYNKIQIETYVCNYKPSIANI